MFFFVFDYIFFVSRIISVFAALAAYISRIYFPVILFLSLRGFSSRVPTKLALYAPSFHTHETLSFLHKRITTAHKVVLNFFIKRMYQDLIVILLSQFPVLQFVTRKLGSEPNYIEEISRITGAWSDGLSHPLGVLSTLQACIMSAT